MTDQTQMSESEKKKEDWMNAKWRPMMGWMYMVVCFCDFVIFPVLWSLLHAILHTANMTQWQPLTLNGAGLFHIAMGAVLGIAAMGRTQEKLAGANNGGAPTAGGFTAPSIPSTGFSGAAGGFSAPAPSPAPAPSSFGGGGFGGAPSAPAPSFGGGFTAPVATTASGKKIVPTGDEPVL